MSFSVSHIKKSILWRSLKNFHARVLFFQSLGNFSREFNCAYLLYLSILFCGAVNWFDMYFIISISLQIYSRHSSYFGCCSRMHLFVYWKKKVYKLLSDAEKKNARCAKSGEAGWGRSPDLSSWLSWPIASHCDGSDELMSVNPGHWSPDFIHPSYFSPSQNFLFFKYNLHTACVVMTGSEEGYFPQSLLESVELM